jgi:hypothetical protein
MTPRLTLHLLLTDCRRCRAWLVIYLALGFLQALAGSLGPASAGAAISLNIVIFAQVVLGVLLIINTIHGDALASDTAGWKTRPIARRHLFGAKLAFLGGVIQFVFVACLVPGWWAAGFNTAQILGSVAQWFIISGMVVWSLAAAASWSAEFKTMMARIGMIALGLIALVIIFRTFGLTTNRQPPSATRSTTLLILVMSLVATGGFASWAIATLFSRLVPAMCTYATACVMALVLVWTSPFDWLHQAPRAWETGSVQLVTDTGISQDLPTGEQLLWSHFRVTSLPPNSLAVPSHLSGQFRARGTHRTVQIHHDQYRATNNRSARIMDSGIADELARCLGGFFPPDTLWFGDNAGGSHRGIPIIAGKEIDGASGTLQASLNFEVFTLKRIADIPLIEGSSHARDGIAVHVMTVVQRENGREFSIRESVPSLWFSDRPEYVGLRVHGSYCLYVIHDPISGEAWPIGRFANRSHGADPMKNTCATDLRLTLTRSALRERLSGIPPSAESGLRLHVFLAESEGSRKVTFKDSNYTWANTRTENRSRQINDASSTDLAALQWPGAENAVAAEKFFDDFFDLLPRRPYGGKISKQAREKLLEIGPAGIPMLLRRLPTRRSVYVYIVEGALQTHAAPEHMPALLDALRRDPEMASFFRSKKWEVEAAKILLPLLATRERILPGDALAIAARFARPEHYADLRWHAGHGLEDNDLLLGLLEKLPEFPFAQTVRDRWHLHLVSPSQDPFLAAHAARLGETDALRQLVTSIEKGTTPARRDKLLALIRDKIDFNGELPDLMSWLSANLELVKYDAELGHYRLTGG